MFKELEPILVAADRRGISRADLAGSAGMAPESLSRLARRESCNLETLRGLARAVGLTVAVVPEDEASAGDGRPVGLFRNAETALRFIVGRLVASLQPEAIWLFGSRGRGDAAPDSDFDVLVVLRDDHPAAGDPQAVLEPLVGSGLAADVVPCTLSEFERARVDQSGLVATVVREGRPLYRARRRSQPDSRE